jgi:hypothetical protein
LISTNDLLQLKLRAQDGDTGSVSDVVFNDGDWAIREFIVDTGGRLFGRRVSIDPDEVLEPDLVNGVLPLELTKEQVKNGPAGVSRSPADEPASEAILAWNESNAMAALPENVLLGGATVPAQPLLTETPPPGMHLRSLSEFDDYVVMADDEAVGKLAGFLVDPIAWDLTLALVQLDSAEGPTVLLPTRLIADLGWPEHLVRTFLDGSTLRNAPVYDPRVLDERVYLPAVADYYSTRV